MSPWLIYLVMQADTIRTLVGFGTFFSVIATVLVLAVFCFSLEEGYENAHEKVKKIAKVVIPIFLVFGLLSGTFPTTKTLMVVIGITAVSSIEGIEKLPPRFVKAFDKLLSDYIGEPEEAE